MGKEPRLLAPSDRRVTTVAAHPGQAIVATGFDLRDTPEDKLPYDPKNIGTAKPQVRPAELKQEPNVSTPPQRKSPRTATETPQQDTDLEMNVNAQQSLNLRG